MGKASRAKTDPGGVSTSHYHEYVPAVTATHIDKSEWGCLAFDQFLFHQINEGVTTPKIPDYTVGYAINGYVRKGLYSFDSSPSNSTTIHQGNVILVNRDTTLTWKWAEQVGENPPLQSVGIRLDAALFQDAAIKCFDRTLDFCEMTSQFRRDDPLLAQLSLALRNEATNKDTTFGALYRESCAQMMAVHLLKHYFNRAFKPGFGSQTLQRRRLGSLTDYVNDNLASRISLSALANLAGISEYHLIREFKRLTGYSPHQYIIKRRIEEARRLLKHTDWSVMRIALEVGYENHSHFSQIFRKSVGCSPRRYRELSR